jgi:hypothetical protein
MTQTGVAYGTFPGGLEYNYPDHLHYKSSEGKSRVSVIELNSSSLKDRNSNTAQISQTERMTTVKE